MSNHYKADMNTRKDYFTWHSSSSRFHLISSLQLHRPFSVEQYRFMSISKHVWCSEQASFSGLKNMACGCWPQNILQSGLLSSTRSFCHIKSVLFKGGTNLCKKNSVRFACWKGGGGVKKFQNPQNCPSTNLIFECTPNYTKK